MTSALYNARKLAAEAEMAIYDALPSALRAAIDNARGSVRSSSVRDALLRGVPEAKIIEVIERSTFVHAKPPSRSQNNE